MGLSFFYGATGEELPEKLSRERRETQKEEYEKFLKKFNK